MRLASLLFLLFVVGCPASTDTPEGLAGRFVDAYFIRFDLDEAERFATGAALERVRKVRELAAFARERVSLEGSKSRVYYDPPTRAQASPDRVQLTYKLEVRTEGGTFERTVIVRVAKRDEGWRVVEFQTIGSPDQLTGRVTGARPEEQVRSSTGSENPAEPPDSDEGDDRSGEGAGKR